MNQSTKTERLADRIDDELMEVEHLYHLLKTNIQPAPQTDAAAFKAQAMKLLTTAQRALEEASSYVRDIKSAPKTSIHKVPSMSTDHTV